MAIKARTIAASVHTIAVSAIAGSQFGFDARIA